MIGLAWMNKNCQRMQIWVQILNFLRKQIAEFFFEKKKLPTGHHRNSKKFNEIQMITDWSIVCKSPLKIFRCAHRKFPPKTVYHNRVHDGADWRETKKTHEFVAISSANECFHSNFLFERFLGKTLGACWNPRKSLTRLVIAEVFHMDLLPEMFLVFNIFFRNEV